MTHHFNTFNYLCFLFSVTYPIVMVIINLSCHICIVISSESWPISISFSNHPVIIIIPHLTPLAHTPMMPHQHTYSSPLKSIGNVFLPPPIALIIPVYPHLFMGSMHVSLFLFLPDAGDKHFSQLIHIQTLDWWWRWLSSSSSLRQTLIFWKRQISSKHPLVQFSLQLFVQQIQLDIHNTIILTILPTLGTDMSFSLTILVVCKSIRPILNSCDDSISSLCPLVVQLFLAETLTHIHKQTC